MKDLASKFKQFQAPTSPNAIGLTIKRAFESTIEDTDGKKYLDFVSGVGVNNVGHAQSEIIDAINRQAEQYLHVMVYGEFAQEKPIELSAKILGHLPDRINSIYLVNSGTEAIEAAIKLVKKVTGKHQLITFKDAYHGSTNGALSLSGNQSRKMPFAPLLPGVQQIRLNEHKDLQYINSKTAAVFLETIQGDAGVIIPDKKFMLALRNRCTATDTLLVLDEIQCGMGRCGTLFAFEQFGIEPDIICLGKALGGGLPIGAFVANIKHTQTLSENPALGHITTFGGHPLPAAAGSASFDIIQKYLPEVEKKGKFIEDALHDMHQIKDMRRVGLMIGVDLKSADHVDTFINKCRDKGLLSFWFLSRPNAFRITPPLTISWEDLEKGIAIIKAALAESED